MTLFMLIQNSKQIKFGIHALLVIFLISGCSSSPVLTPAPAPAIVQAPQPPVTIVISQPETKDNFQKVSTDAENCYRDYTIKYKECYDFVMPVSTVKRDKLLAECLVNAGYPEGSETCRNKLQP